VGKNGGVPILGRPPRKESLALNGNGSTPVLALKGVGKSFGPVQALSNVDFEVRPAEVVALGPAGDAGRAAELGRGHSHSPVTRL
jgi:hypothetical protein